MTQGADGVSSRRGVSFVAFAIAVCIAARSAMVRKIVITLALTAAAVVLGGNAAAWARGAEFAGPGPGVTGNRSEEHTSELQSHVNLVCRLLLEKKKKKKHNVHFIYILH